MLTHFSMKNLLAALSSLALVAAGCSCTRDDYQPAKVTEPWQSDWQQFVQKLAPKIQRRPWDTSVNWTFDNHTVEWSGTVDDVKPLSQQDGTLNGGAIFVSMPPVTFTLPDSTHLTVSNLNLFAMSEAEWTPWASLKPGAKVTFRTVLATDNGFAPVAGVIGIKGRKIFLLKSHGAVLLAEKTGDP